MKQPIKGFSKLSKQAKIEWLAKEYLSNPNSQEDGSEMMELLKSYWHSDEKTQKLHDEFIENTISNFYMPFGVAPNFLINDKLCCIPMVIEESSVVAAAAKSANFWLERGGFKTEVLSTKKIGQVHFAWHGDSDRLKSFFNKIKHKFYEGTEKLSANMLARGGGILDIELVDKTLEEPNYYQLHATFETCDSMGANFINSILEEFSKILEFELKNDLTLDDSEKNVLIIMCILSNYTPECIVRAEVSCAIDQLQLGADIDPNEFADKFQKAVHIAQIEPYRATTHNKGIFNGIDSVILATGNDFRAVEACGHTYASRHGKYQSLTNVEVKDGIFKFWIEIPMALGTVGGLTALHPMVKLAHKILGNPNAQELMQIVAATGLAQNFSALRSLVTTGIQKGHMKMHLMNILNQLEATEEEKVKVQLHFTDKVISHKAVVDYFRELRGISTATPYEQRTV